MAATTGAIAGEKGGNGGDPVIEREQRIRQLIELNPATGKSVLRERALRLMEGNPTWSAIKDPIVRGTLVDMRERGLRADILQSPYRVSNPCLDQDGNSMSATSILNDPSGPICWDTFRLARLNASDQEVLALLFHEHAHHFGYVDSTMAINSAILEMVKTPGAAQPSPITSVRETNISKWQRVAGRSLAVREDVCGLILHVDRQSSKILAESVNNPWTERSCLISGSVSEFYCDITFSACSTNNFDGYRATMRILSSDMVSMSVEGHDVVVYYMP